MYFTSRISWFKNSMQVVSSFCCQPHILFLLENFPFFWPKHRAATFSFASPALIEPVYVLLMSECSITPAHYWFCRYFCNFEIRAVQSVLCLIGQINFICLICFRLTFGYIMFYWTTSCMYACLHHENMGTYSS